MTARLKVIVSLLSPYASYAVNSKVVLLGANGFATRAWVSGVPKAMSCDVLPPPGTDTTSTRS